MSECSVPCGMQSEPHAEPHTKEHAPAHPCPEHLLACHGMPRPRRKVLCIAPDHGPTAPTAVSHRGPIIIFDTAAAKAPQSPAPIPDSGVSLPAKSLLPPPQLPWGSNSCSPAHPSFGLGFQLCLPRARQPQQGFPWAFQKNELPPQWQRGKEETQNREPTWRKSKHLKGGLTILNDDLDEPN